MGVIVGILIHCLTFPGLIVDAFILKLICQLFDIKVFKVNYFDILAKNDGVEHEIPTNYFKIFG